MTERQAETGRGHVAFECLGNKKNWICNFTKPDWSRSLRKTNSDTSVASAFSCWRCFCSPLSPCRLWSSWILNFSQCLTWSEPTGPSGRNWIRRDNVAKVCLRRRAPAVATAQKRVAALWSKQATGPAAATAPTAHHLNLSVSCFPAALFGLFPLKCGLQPKQCSACRGSWALLLSASATRDELSECGAFIEVLLLLSVFLCRRLSERLRISWPRRRNSPLCQHVNPWAYTSQQVMENSVEECFFLCCGSFCSRYLLVTRFLSGATEIFFVNLYISSWVSFKCCFITCELWMVMWLLVSWRIKGCRNSSTCLRCKLSAHLPPFLCLVLRS